MGETVKCGHAISVILMWTMNAALALHVDGMKRGIQWKNGCADALHGRYTVIIYVIDRAGFQGNN